MVVEEGASEGGGAKSQVHSIWRFKSKTRYSGHPNSRSCRAPVPPHLPDPFSYLMRERGGASDATLHLSLLQRVES
jgi:hypothetical protein